MNGDAETIDEIWREHRPHVLGVAYRMLGDIGDAEDVVQEAFTRLMRADRGEIRDVRGWMITVVGRLCLDHLGTARVRYESQAPYEGFEYTQLDGQSDPADRVTLDDSVRVALLVVLRELTPAERTVFVLHDVFQYRFEEIADIVGRSVPACRQLASRARRHVESRAGGESRFRVERADERRVTEEFIAACAGAGLEALMRLLDPDVVGRAEFGGGAIQRGRDTVGRNLMRFFGRSSLTLVPQPLDTTPGVLAFHDRELVAVLALKIQDGLIVDIHVDGDRDAFLRALRAPTR